MQNESNALQALVAFLVVPKQLAAAQAKAHLATLTKCPVSATNR